MINPARKAVEELEAGVANLEKRVSKAQGEMTLASASSNGAAIQLASQELSLAQKLLQEKYAEWEDAVQKLSELEKIHGSATEEV